MWPFKRKKHDQVPGSLGPLCPHCGARNTGLKIIPGFGDADYVKVWRGQRVLTYRCYDCGRDFYSDAPDGSVEDLMTDSIIDDEEALHEAEEEIRRQTEEENDRRYRG